MGKKFFEEIPFVRAIACMMVVSVHITVGTIVAEDGSTNQLNLYLYQMTRLGTPIFAIISAFLLYSSVLRSGFSFKRFITSRTVKVVSPFLIWTVLYLSYKTFYLEKDMFANPERTIGYFVFGTGHYHLYFMVTVIQFYILFPLLQLVRVRKLLLALFFLSIPFNAYWLMYAEAATPYKFLNLFLTHRSSVLHWISFFLFGAVLAAYYKEILKVVKKQWILLAALASIMFTALAIEIDPENIFSSSRPINLLYVPLFVLFLLAMHQFVAKSSIILKAFNLVGNYSMGIYLVHPLVKLQLLRVLPSEFWDPPLILMTFLIILIASMLVVRLILLLPFSSFIVPVGKAKPHAGNAKTLSGSGKANNRVSVPNTFQEIQ